MTGFCMRTLKLKPGGRDKFWLCGGFDTLIITMRLELSLPLTPALFPDGGEGEPLCSTGNFPRLRRFRSSARMHPPAFTSIFHFELSTLNLQ